MSEQEDLPRAYVNPQYGPVGTLFRFSATGFRPHTLINVSIYGPNKQPIYEDNFDAGSGGDIYLEERATSLWPLGTYHFKVTGKFGIPSKRRSHKEETISIVENFEITR